MRAGTYASRVHLAARSEHFRAMLYGGMLENFRETCREGVELKDVSYVVFLKILEFLYTETVLDIPPDVAVPLLIAAEQTCARPFFSPSNQAYDVALRNVKRRRNARFRGLVRFVLLLEPMRLQAATKVYAPGGAGFAAAAASFRAAAVHSKGPVSRPACASSTATPATPAMPGRRRQRRQGRRRQRRR